MTVALPRAKRPEPSALRTETILLLLSVLAIVVNFGLTFWSWKPRWLTMGADEDVWVASAVKYWKSGTASPVVHVPLFHDLVAFFVGGTFVKLETGYVIWRVLVYLSASGLLFYVLRRVSNLWVALVLTLNFEWILYLYNGPTYTVLAAVFYMGALALVATDKKLTGVAFGVLLLGALVRLELLFFLATALVLLLVLAPKTLLSRRFLAGIVVPVLLFVGLIYRHGSSLTRFPSDYVVRGQMSVVWYLVDFMDHQGEFRKYTNLPWYQAPPETIDKVLVENFGKNKKQLIESSFLELWRRNPQIMRARYTTMPSELRQDLNTLFTLKPPYGGPSRRYWAMTAAILLLLVVLGVYAGTTDRASPSPFMSSLVLSSSLGYWLRASPEFVGVMVCGFAGFVPWLMTDPQPHYLIMAIPIPYALTAMLVTGFGAIRKRGTR